MTLYADFTDALDVILDAMEAENALPAGVSRAGVTVEPPRDPAHGDLAINAAMVLAKRAGVSPRVLAEALADRLARLPAVADVTIAGPGFLNLRLTAAPWRQEIRTILARGAGYGASTRGADTVVNVEYVSANPTGPMHMGHCRGAVVGDALANLLAFVGHRVVREYYVNDAGAQVDTLARSVHLRYLEALGRPAGTIPEGLYPGDYLIPLGEALAQELGDQYADAPEAEWLPLFRARAVAAMLALIRQDLALLGIHHHVFSSEAEVLASGKPEAAEARLRAAGLVYDGVLEPPKGKPVEDWEPVVLPLFKATAFGDDVDRPIRKSGGQWTYFGIDLAYHFQKAEQAAELVDIWGADHSGTVKRIKAAVAALAGADYPFDVKLVQMVQLLRDGQPVKMSKRSGSFVTLADVVTEVGKDVVRFAMLTRKADAQMDFDFAKVVEASKENPVFYVQYAHARIASLGRKFAEHGWTAGQDDLMAGVDRLDDEDLALVAMAAQFPRIVEAAATAREPHRIAFYLYDLASALHTHWHVGHDRPDRRFLTESDREMSTARLALAQAVGQVLRNGLALMGVEAATRM